MRRAAARVVALAREADVEHAALVCRQLQIAAAERVIEVGRRHADLARADDLARPRQEAVDLVLDVAQGRTVAGQRAATTHHAEIAHGNLHRPSFANAADAAAAHVFDPQCNAGPRARLDSLDAFLRAVDGGGFTGADCGPGATTAACRSTPARRWYRSGPPAETASRSSAARPPSQ